MLLDKYFSLNTFFTLTNRIAIWILFSEFCTEIVVCNIYIMEKLAHRQGSILRI